MTIQATTRHGTWAGARRLLGLLALACAVVATLGSSLVAATPAAAAGAQTDTAAGSGVVPIIQVGGLLDPILADFLIDAIGRADADPRTRAVVLEVNSEGAVIEREKLNEVAAAIADAKVPITAWIGPAGARATGEVAQLIGLTDRIAVAPKARLGNTGPSMLDARFGEPWGERASLLLNRTVGHDEAIAEGFAPNSAPIIGEFVAQLSDEYPVEVRTTDDGGTQVLSSVRFERLTVLKGWMHSVASAPVAYLLFALGMALVIFEFYTAGVGLAGIIGAGCLLLGSYGLGVLPTRTWAVVVLVLSMIAYAIDVQAGVPRFWTAVGTIAFIVGTLGLYTDGVSMSWIPMVVGVVSMLLMMLVGMPTMVRTRFSTPTIGRDSMIGLEGAAIEAVDPDGVVSIQDALWKARTNRATPIAVGDTVRVAAIDGLWLEVEPIDGAARDYRER